MRHATALLAAALLAAHALFAAGPAAVRISYVKSPFNLPLIVGARRGTFEQAFAKAGAAVKFFEIDFRGQADRGHGCGLPGHRRRHQHHLGDPGGGRRQRGPDRFRLQPAHRPVRHRPPRIPPSGPPADLKGRRVAGPKGTALHQLLAAALDKARLSMQDVSFLQMDLPAARTALLSGQVDAALLAAANVTLAQAAGAHVVATADGYIKPQLVVAARGGFLRDHPQLVDLYVATHKEILQWIAAHREEALAIGAKEQGIPVAEARALADGSHFTADLGPAEVAALGADVDFMIRAGMLRSPVDPKALLRPGLVK